MKYILSIFILFCLFCGSMAVAECESTIITDDYCHASDVSAVPQTIVSLAPSNTEILFALGLGDRVVGVTEYCDYPAEARTKSVVGGVSSVNVEKIVAIDPDLIIANIMNGEDNIAHLRKLGYSVLCLNPDSINGTLCSIYCIGEVTGTSSVAAELVASMQQRFHVAVEKVKISETTPLTVQHLMSADPYWVSGNHTFQNELITLAGGVNAFPEVDGWGIINLERLLTADPDVILVDSGGGMGKKGQTLLKQSLMTDPRLSSLSAVKSNRVYVMDADTFDRGGPRIVDAFDELVSILHSVDDDNSIPFSQTSDFGLSLLLTASVVWFLIFRKMI